MKKFIFILSVLLAFCFTGCDSKTDLAKAVEISNQEFPTVVEEGIICQGINYLNNVVTYTYTVDESLYDMESLLYAKTEIKNNLIDNLTNSYDSDLEEFINLVIKEEAQIIYKYVGASTGQVMKIVINYYEL